MLLMLFRKIYKNKWMVLCLLLGLILAISIICAIPMFSRGMIKGVVQRDLKNAKEIQNINLGYYASSMTISDKEASVKKAYNSFEAQNAINLSDLGLKINEEKAVLSVSQIQLIDENSNSSSWSGLKFGAISNIEKHISIIQGNIFSGAAPKDGCYEAIISDYAQKSFDLELGQYYYIKSPNSQKRVKIKIVGLYKEKNIQDNFWDKKDNSQYCSILINYQVFKKDILFKDAIFVDEISIYEYFDYSQLADKNIRSLVEKISSKTVKIKKFNGSIIFPAYNTLKEDINKEIQLNSILTVLEVPIIILVIIYTFMISDMIAEQEKNEIAVLKSRGAGTIGICLTYLMQALVISVVALLAGPLLGVLQCRILGVCNGFLEFTNRSAIDVQLTGIEYRNSLIAAAVFIVTIMLPVILSTRTTIVQYKQSKSKKKQPVWKKYFLDVLLLGAAGYGYYNYNSRQKYINISGISSNQVPIDPIVYLIMGIFIMGIALLFLRVYPYIVKLIFFLVKNRCSQTAYASLINVGRSIGREQFLMVFLIFTLSIGIFDMKAANIINHGIECNERYLLGADMTLQAWWNFTEDDKKISKSLKANHVDQDSILHSYTEPLFSDYQHLKGVQSVTKVFTTDNGDIKILGSSGGTVRIMGIIPYEFAQTAYFQENLLPAHWYNYCNALTRDKYGILISSSLADHYNFSLGDKITYFWKGSPEFEGTVYGIVNYWPSYNPNDSSRNDLIIANLSMLQSNMPVQPYQVWIKKISPDSTEDIYNSIIAKRLYIQDAKDANQIIEEAKSEPMIQGTNGALTLGFAATMVITAMGFIIYWIISIKGKMLQFGILRAMGMHFRKIIGMILYEQVMISGAAIGIGVIVGQLAARIFMPLMNLASNSNSKPIPSDMILSTVSYTKLVIIIIFTLLAGILSLITCISNMKIDQVIKLGED